MRGPAKTKIGRRTFITADALEEWLRACQQNNRPQPIGSHNSDVSPALADPQKKEVCPGG